jgi:glycosyltransferase involved in cell wall biosynthesis
MLDASVRLRTFLAPFEIQRKAHRIADLIQDLRPDLVHAMRLPFEALLAAHGVKDRPLLISIWGNDFSLFADRDRRLRQLTASALRRANGIHCDCHRDLQAALSYGFSAAKPARVLPGNGGLKLSDYFGTKRDPEFLRNFDIPTDRPLVFNPRGLRAYVQNETFFRAIPRVLSAIPDAFFVAVGMRDNPIAERWLLRSGAERSVRLLPMLMRKELATLFASSQVSVSPSTHDGTPNTLLEAMASGCFPVAGDLPSLREWIEDGENGLLCDARSPESLAECIVRALRDPDLRSRAAVRNRGLIAERADYSQVMLAAEDLYQQLATATPLIRAATQH